VADEDRGLIEALDVLLVVVDDLVKTEALELVAALAKLRDVAFLSRPLGRGHVIAASLEELREVLPASG
jgi:hypothetical protein